MEEKSPDVVKLPQGTIIRRLSWGQELKDGRGEFSAKVQKRRQ